MSTRYEKFYPRPEPTVQEANDRWLEAFGLTEQWAKTKAHLLAAFDSEARQMVIDRFPLVDQVLEDAWNCLMHDHDRRARWGEYDPSNGQPAPVQDTGLRLIDV